MKATFKRTLTGFAPTDPDSAKILGRYDVGELARGEFVKARNLKHHNLFMKLIDVVHSNLPEYLLDQLPTPEHLRKRILANIGYTDIVSWPRGKQPAVENALSFLKRISNEYPEARGIAEELREADGYREYVRSMSFMSADQDVFEKEIWNPALDLIVQKVLPNIGREQLEAEVYELTGLSLPSARPGHTRADAPGEGGASASPSPMVGA